MTLEVWGTGDSPIYVYRELVELGRDSTLYSSNIDTPFLSLCHFSLPRYLLVSVPTLLMLACACACPIHHRR